MFVPSLITVKDFIERAKERNIGVAFDSEFARRNQIRLMTVHKSKGLEAKVVFILNAIKGTYGFPCEIEDSSIYAAAREDYPNQDQKKEERRLFYVAVTRAKEDLTIYTWEPLESEFLEEIKDHINEDPHPDGLGFYVPRPRRVKVHYDNLKESSSDI